MPIVLLAFTFTVLALLGLTVKAVTRSAFQNRVFYISIVFVSIPLMTGLYT
jgi:hypothetical protein